MAEQSLKERLKALPRCLRIAFAVRCARRVQPLTTSLPRNHVLGIDRSLSILEQAARGEEADLDYADATTYTAYVAAYGGAADAARAAAYAADADDADAAYAAAYAAGDAAGVAAAYAADAAAGVAAASQNDLRRLEQLSQSGVRTIDPTEAGPLGPYWDQSKAPDWYESMLAELRSILGPDSQQSSTQKPPPTTAPPSVKAAAKQELVFEFCVPDDYDQEQIQQAAGKLALAADEYYRSLGGPGLTVESIELEQPIMEVVP